jgi:hypothetical protein
MRWGKFNSELNFTSHIDSLLSKAKQRLYLLKKSFVSCSDYALIIAFKTYVVPLLEYCSPVWSPCTVTDIVRIESIQRSFTKSLKICNALPYKERLIICNLCSLERRRLTADLVLFDKVHNNLVSLNLGHSLQPFGSSITRGHSCRYKIPPARINSRHHSYANRTIKVWNCLSQSVVEASSVFMFKQSLAIENLTKFLIIGF